MILECLVCWLNFLNFLGWDVRIIVFYGECLVSVLDIMFLNEYRDFNIVCKIIFVKMILEIGIVILECDRFVGVLNYIM